MKKAILLLLAFFFSILNLSGQSGETKSATVSLNPSGNGYVLSNIKLRYGFRNCYGDVVMAVNWTKEAICQSYKYEGQTYSAQEVGNAFKQSFRIGSITHLYADLYYGNSRLGSVKHSYLTGFTGTGCFGDTQDPLGAVGLDKTDKKWKDNINQLRLANIRVEFSTEDYKVNDAIKAKVRDKEFNEHYQRAQNLEAQGDYDAAIEAYRDAGRAKSYSDVSEDIRRVNGLKRDAQNEDKARALAQEALDAASVEDYGTAEQKYRQAARLNTSRSGEYERLANDMESRGEAVKAAQREAEQEAAANDYGNEENEEGEGETEGEGEGEEESIKLSKNGDDEEGESSDSSSSGGGGGGGMSAEEYAAYQEYERQKRVAEYWESRNAATEANMQAAGQMGAAALLVHWLIGEMIYANMDYDSPINLMEGPGNLVTIRGGYGFGSVPIFTNSEYELYDGNNFSTSTTTDNYQSYTLELGMGMDYWPIFSENFGLGAGLSLYAGHGILFQQFSTGGSLELKGFVGGEGLQLFGSYSRGERNVYHSPWLDPGESGSGTAETSYSRIMAGPQFRVVKERGGDWTTYGFYGIFERNEAWGGNFGPALMFNHSPGLRFEYNQRNRYNIYAEAVFNYRRAGEVEYGYDDEATFNGTMFNVAVHRRFDVHAASALRLKNPAKAYRMIHDYNGPSLKIGQPAVTWLQSDSSGVRSTEGFVGANPIGFEYSQKLYKGLSLVAAAEASYNGIRYDANNTDTSNFGNFNPYLRVHRIGLNIPLGLRLNVPSTFARYFIEGGISYSHYFVDILESRRRDYNEFWETEEDIALALHQSYLNYRLGIGMAFPTGNAMSTVSLIFERSQNPIMDPDFTSDKFVAPPPEDVFLNRLSISYSISL